MLDMISVNPFVAFSRNLAQQPEPQALRNCCTGLAMLIERAATGAISVTTAGERNNCTLI
jgi:hypothetical protein